MELMQASHKKDIPKEINEKQIIKIGSRFLKIQVHKNIKIRIYNYEYIAN